MRSLIVQAGGRRYVIAPSQLVTIGRDPACTVPLDDERVSRRHGVLRADGDTWIYEDLNSRNGSFVSGARITSQAVGDGSSLRLGNPIDGPLLELAAAVEERSSSDGTLRRNTVAAGALLIVLIVAAQGLDTVRSLSATSTATPAFTRTPATTIARADAVAAGRTGTVRIVQGNTQGTGSYLGDGRVLTAAHVVSTTAPVIVFFADQRANTSTVVRIDADLDLALLSVTGLDSLGARPLEWADSDLLRLGDELIALGYPEGLPFSVKVGVVSGLRPGRPNFIQTDASLNHGMSGGPVLDSAGHLVGITDWGYQGVVGLNFAIASSTARGFVDRR